MERNTLNGVKMNLPSMHFKFLKMSTLTSKDTTVAGFVSLNKSKYHYGFPVWALPHEYVIGPPYLAMYKGY